MESAAEELEALGIRVWGRLSAAEEGALRSFASGFLVECVGPSDPDSNPQNGAKWHAERSIRAGFLRWLLTDGSARKLADPRGLQISYVRIDDRLILDHADLPPFAIQNSFIPKGIALYNAKARTVILTGTHVGGIDARLLNVDGSVDMNDGFLANGTVLMNGVRVSGDVNCGGSTFLSNERFDTSAATPGVPVLTVSIAGSRIGGSVRLNHGSRFEGPVHLTNLVVGGDLLLEGGRLLSDGSEAVVAQRMSIAGSLALSGIVTNGYIDVSGSSIGGQLSCLGAQFDQPGTKTPTNAEKKVPRSGLIAEHVSIEKTFIWSEVRNNAETVLDLAFSKCSELYDDRKSWPTPGNLHIDGFRYSAFSAGPSDANTRLDWLKLAGRSGTFREDSYEQLILVFRQIGKLRDARRVAIAMRVAERKSGQLGLFGRMWNWVLWISIGYGYRVQLVLLWGGLLLAAGALVSHQAYKKGLMLPTSEAANQSVQFTRSCIAPPGYPIFSSVGYSLDVLVPFLDLGQEANWAPSTSQVCGPQRELRFAEFLRPASWVYRALGWGLATLFVVGFTALVRRE